MKPFPPVSRPCWAWCAAALLCTATVSTVSAQESSAQSRYRAELRVCRDGSSPQSRADCEREAHNAYAEARRGGLVSAPERYTSNALRRCDAFNGDDRRDCEARLAPSARVDGSVGGGGLLREGVSPAPSR